MEDFIINRFIYSILQINVNILIYWLIQRFWYEFKKLWEDNEP